MTVRMFSSRGPHVESVRRQHFDGVGRHVCARRDANPDDSSELEQRGKGRVIPIILDISRGNSIEYAAERVRSIV